MPPEPTKPSESGPAPQFWSRSTNAGGEDVLTYAIREGAGYFVLLALGAASLLCGGWAMYWLASGGGLTVAGVIFLLLGPGGAMLFGVFSLDAALWRRHTYALGAGGIEARRHSLFGDKHVEIQRSSIEAISQTYSPPGPSAPRSSQGDWVTFVVHRDLASGGVSEYALEGMHTREEARWLGGILSRWAKAPLKRSFAAAFDEADPSLLPVLDE